MVITYLVQVGAAVPVSCVLSSRALRMCVAIALPCSMLQLLGKADEM